MLAGDGAAGQGDLTRFQRQLAPSPGQGMSEIGKAVEHLRKEGRVSARPRQCVLPVAIHPPALPRMAPAGKLGAMQYRVNVPYAEVRALAHAVGFPLDVWLWDRYYGS